MKTKYYKGLDLVAKCPGGNKFPFFSNFPLVHELVSGKLRTRIITSPYHQFLDNLEEINYEDYKIELIRMMLEEK